MNIAFSIQCYKKLRAKGYKPAAALAAVRRCDEAISYNVSPETCIDAMLFEIREVLYGSHSAD